MLLKQFGDFNPPEADKCSAFNESFSKSGQNRSQKTFYKLVKFRHFIFLTYPIKLDNYVPLYWAITLSCV